MMGRKSYTGRELLSRPRLPAAHAASQSVPAAAAACIVYVSCNEAVDSVQLCCYEQILRLRLTLPGTVYQYTSYGC